MRFLLITTSIGIGVALGGCGVVHPVDTSGMDAAPEPEPEAVLGVHLDKPGCDHLMAYVRDWEVDRAAPSVRLKGFVRFVNQGKTSVDLTGLLGGLPRATDPDIEVVSFTERWVPREGLVVHPDEQAGFLTQLATEIITPMIHTVANRTYDLNYFEVDRWDLAADKNLPVSVEIGFETHAERWDLHVRMIPGTVTRPLAGAYSCGRTS